nr:hypothetical protein [Paenibacillus xylanexedens]
MSMSDSVMMIPPPLGAERDLELEMKKIREGYIRDLGRTDYEKHISKVNQDFKSLIAKKGVRL